MAIEVKECKVCKAKFVGTARAVFCGVNCKQTDYYSRKKLIKDK
jgi:hypothetical protein